jgi:serine/threonine-protein kinase
VLFIDVDSIVAWAASVASVENSEPILVTTSSNDTDTMAADIPTSIPEEEVNEPVEIKVSPTNEEPRLVSQTTVQKTIEGPAIKPTELTKPVEVAATITEKPAQTPERRIEPTEIATPIIEIEVNSSERLSTLDGMAQVFVDEGGFLMGAGSDASHATADERPQNEIYLDSYWIDKTEVTNNQFAQFLNDTGNHRGTCLGADCMKVKEQHELSHIFLQGDHYEVESGYEDHPVIMITWYGASTYCHWADRRLPTSAEWEKAARGDDGRTFPWGNQFSGDEANFCDQTCEIQHRDANYDDGYAYTAPVGSYPDGASPYGALDMAGNVTEYVSDWYDEHYYQVVPLNNPAGPDNGTLRVRRGSAWIGTLPDMRITFRSKSTPDSLNNNVGFRCAQSD